VSDQDEYLTSAETAALLGYKNNTLEIKRCQGKGPPFIKLGDTPQAPVRYRRSDVEEWIAARRFASTSAFAAAARLPARQPICSSY
jgi:predicted DNA-binding transcriptional regulator AlpA